MAMELINNVSKTLREDIAEQMKHPASPSMPFRS